MKKMIDGKVYGLTRVATIAHIPLFSIKDNAAYLFEPEKTEVSSSVDTKDGLTSMSLFGGAV